MATNNVVGGPVRVTLVTYMECQRNTATIPGIRAVDGCLKFEKSVNSEDPMICANCGCNRSFHRMEQVDGGQPQPQPQQRPTTLSRRAIAAAAGAPLPPLSPKTPRRAPAAGTPPPPPPPPPPYAAPYDNTGSENLRLGGTMGDGNMPLKKRKLKVEDGEVSAESSSGKGN